MSRRSSPPREQPPALAARVVFGLHSVGGLIEHEPERVLSLAVDPRRHDRRIAALLARARTAGIAVEPTRSEILDRLSGGGNHQGALARVRPRAPLSEDGLARLLDGLIGPLLLLGLDGVQDPHNLGACLRTADAAGAHALITPRDRAVGLTAAARKVASGAAETVPFVQVTNLARCLRRLGERGLWRIGAAAQASGSLYDCDLRRPLVLVLGGEQGGLRRLTRESCDALVRLPMRGRVDSLNVAVAAGICLYEALRQRGAIV